MINYNPHGWIHLIFNPGSKNIVKKIWPPMITLVVYTTAMVYAFNVHFKLYYPGATAIHSLLGVVLGLFLVFRINTAYDRWWEGRKHWGALVNVCRNFALKINSVLADDQVKEKAFFSTMISNFAFAMKEHLRDGVIKSEMQDPEDGNFMEVLLDKSHPPMYIVDRMYVRLADLNKKGMISGQQFIVIDQDAKELMNVIGACERIKNTPIPYSYNMFIKKFIFLYTVSLPIGIMSITHFWTVPAVAVIFYLLVSTELIAEEIEEPFGRDDNDLPTDELCDKIKANIEMTLLESK